MGATCKGDLKQKNDAGEPRSDAERARLGSLLKDVNRVSAAPADYGSTRSVMMYVSTARMYLSREYATELLREARPRPDRADARLRRVLRAQAGDAREG